ncbi:DNA polymerase III, delta subunit [Croceitalea dokdonensis DOKDO 023]|uniref:DNA polymerase III subunit delta n=1 Tax=Croceitalea dokdonensis DOKDO 023 TaxID=1300341 RepID=A0A0P7A9J8_9FLAO|nr:DNA polymerase III subunit delta [Croceitalea dokdonensis]KPM33527.1 DNA polymerase III, delta subunit [Croceitalea dokdonensis DOKDO 023]
MEEAKRIVTDVNNGILKPIYFLMGEEPYYIDKISDYIGKTVLTEAERGFNQMVIYGKDATVDDIVSNAKRFPMMAEHQVIIVKEAQHLSRTIEQLVAYAEQPQPTTVLVVCYKYKTIDKRKKLYKTLKKTGVILESKKLYENQIADWIRRVLLGKGYKIHPKASALLVEFLGMDLNKIDNELNKLFLVVKKGEEISPEVVEKHIGISKDFNNFELRKAIGSRDVVKANRIVNYFAQNPKANPFVVTISSMYSFFVQLLKYHGLKDRSKNSVASTLGISPFFVGEYQIAAKNYPMKEVSRIISSIRGLDVKGKGVGTHGISEHDLLKELLAAVF